MSAVAEMGEADSIVIAAVERAFGAFGESAKKAIFWHLANAGVIGEEIPWRPSHFVRALSEIFGSGAKVIESEIVRQIKETEPGALKAATLPDIVYELKNIERTRREASVAAAH